MTSHPIDMLRLRHLALLAVALFSLSATASDDTRTRYDYFFTKAMTERAQFNHTAAFELLRHCVAIDPSASEAYFFLGQYYGMMKDKPLMLAHFKRAADMEPDNETFLETLAQAYIENGQLDSAITTLETLTKAHTARADVLEMLTQLYQQQGEYRQMVRALDRLEALEGKNEKISYAKSGAYTQAGDKKAAIAEMRKLAEQFPNDLGYKSAYGDILLLNGEKTKAFKTYQEILAEEPDNIHALNSLRAYYNEQGDKQSSDSITRRILLNKATSVEGRASLMRQLVGENEAAGGDSTKILSLFREMQAQPNPSADLVMMQATYMTLKKMPADSVRPVLQHVVSLDPANSSARLRLVGMAWEADSMEQVAELCHTATEYIPDVLPFYYFRGLALYRLEKDTEALDAFQKGVAACEDKSDVQMMSDTYALIGDILSKLDRTDEAFAAYDSCLAWKEDNIGCLNNYAYYLSLQNRRLDEAERMSKQTITAEPKNATYLDTYAWILFLQKRYAEARIYIDQAVKLDTAASAVIMEHAGDIHALDGDTEGAVTLWQQAQQADPDNKLVARKIKQRRYIREK